MSFRLIAVAMWSGFLLLAGQADALAQCRETSQTGTTYTVCDFDPGKTRIELFNLDDGGNPLGTFPVLESYVRAQGKKLIFAMNAGMFDDALKPVGLYVEDGVQAKKLNRRGGSGNFHLKPNGVFYLINGKAAVTESERYAKLKIVPNFATQSGPMLVIDGALHPKFSPDGTSLKIRNGVGVRADGVVVFVISEDPVNFHDFALLFRDTLMCPNALFLDGSVSSLYAPELGRNDRFLALGPMVGAVEVQ